MSTWRAGGEHVASTLLRSEHVPEHVGEHVPEHVTTTSLGITLVGITRLVVVRGNRRACAIFNLQGAISPIHSPGGRIKSL